MTGSYKGSKKGNTTNNTHFRKGHFVPVYRATIRTYDTVSIQSLLFISDKEPVSFSTSRVVLRHSEPFGRDRR